MSWLFVFILLGILCALIAAVITALWKHKKSGTGEVRLVEAIAVVESTLAPEGSVIIAGELWRARSIDGTDVARNVRVRVVELRGHLLIVRPAA